MEGFPMGLAMGIAMSGAADINCSVEEVLFSCFGAVVILFIIWIAIYILWRIYDAVDRAMRRIK